VGSGLSFAPGSWSIVSAGVPEPASGSLMLLAGGLLALLRRRTRR
jgi:hypothetical protein